LDALLSRSLCTEFGATEVTRLETTCGGTIIVEDSLFQTQEWEFDEDGQLISVLNHSDAVQTCDETGGYSATTLYGAELCEVTNAEPVVVCTRGGGGGGEGGGGGQGGGGGAGGAPGGAGGGGGAEN
jgi:hypothetical protein